MSEFSSILANDAVGPLAAHSAPDVSVRMERADAQLVELVLAGDAYAFEEIFERHKRVVAIVASRYFRRREEIEEIIQIAFAKAFADLGAFRGAYELSLAGWLCRIAANASIDVIRSQRRKPERLDCELSEAETAAMHRIAGAAPLAEHAVVTRDLASKLMDALTPLDRALLTMLYGDEMSIAEIAVALGLSQSNVKIRAWRARRAMRVVLERLL